MAKKIELTTLLELSKVFRVKKATLIYYTQLGLFVPEMTAGKTALFDKTKALKTWETIKVLRKKNTLSQIRVLFSEKNADCKK
jgi:DNA-binding transcriptional MerR regulator